MTSSFLSAYGEISRETPQLVSLIDLFTTLES